MKAESGNCAAGARRPTAGSDELARARPRSSPFSRARASDSHCRRPRAGVQLERLLSRLEIVDCARPGEGTRKNPSANEFWE